MKARGFGTQTATIAMVNADYELAKMEARGSHLVTVPMVERRFKVRAGQLRNFRANLPRKKTPVPEL